MFVCYRLNQRLFSAWVEILCFSVLRATSCALPWGTSCYTPPAGEDQNCQLWKNSILYSMDTHTEQQQQFPQFHTISSLPPPAAAARLLPEAEPTGRGRADGQREGGRGAVTQAEGPPSSTQLLTPDPPPRGPDTQGPAHSLRLLFSSPRLRPLLSTRRHFPRRLDRRSRPLFSVHWIPLPLLTPTSIPPMRE